MLEMSEQEKFDYLRRKREAAEAERARLDEEHRRRQDELNRALEEAKRVAVEEAKRKAELEARLAFSKSVREEHSLLDANQSVTRAFTFSYYDLMRYLADLERRSERDEGLPSATLLLPPPKSQSPNKMNVVKKPTGHDESERRKFS